MEKAEKTYAIPHKQILNVPLKTFNAEGVEIEKVRIEKLVFAVPLNAGMIANIPAGDGADLTMGHFYPIIANMTGQTLANINKLDVSDLLEAIEVVGYFLDGGPKTGATN